MDNSSIQTVRDFNRFYTGIIGLLDKHILESRFSLPEVRVLFEINARRECMASDIKEVMRIDRGYLSRMLQNFSRQKLIVRSRSKKDGRAIYLKLTAKGEEIFQSLDQASARQIQSLLEPLSKKEREDLIGHMIKIKEILFSSVSKTV